MNNEAEIWRNVIDFENFYQVSNKGRVKSIVRVKERSNGRPHSIKETILKNRFRGKQNKKYCVVRLYNNIDSKSFSVHRLVAKAFIPNPNNLPLVNHKDGNKLNNNDWNLEWCTDEYNQQHAKNTLRVYVGRSIKVDIYSMHGNKIHSADSIKEAATIINGDRKCIKKVCLGEQKHHKGYRFVFN